MHTKKVTPYFQAVRALTATVFQRVYRPIIWSIGGILVILWIACVTLGLLVSHWWFLGLIVLIPLTLIVGLVAWIVQASLMKLYPRPLDAKEKQSLNAFGDKVVRLVELRATPPFVMAALIAKDLLRGRNSSYIEGIISDSTSLRQDFRTIVSLFPGQK